MNAISVELLRFITHLFNYLYIELLSNLLSDYIYLEKNFKFLYILRIVSIYLNRFRERKRDTERERERERKRNRDIN